MKVRKMILIIIVLIVIAYIVPNHKTVMEQVAEVEEKIEMVVVATEEEEQKEITTISQNGVDFIKSKEGLILTSKKYKGEKNYTIGYGHCQSDVKASQTITEEQAEEILKKDLIYFSNAVVANCSYLKLNQNEFDALVSFTYNLGVGNLKQLTANGTRTKEEIANHITAYTGSGNEENRQGLLNRRNAEMQLFLGE